MGMIKRLIDVDKFLERVKKDREHECYLHSWTADMVLERLDSWYAPTVNAIVIPDNATNGDVIKALFPDIEIYDAEKMESIYTGIPFGKYIGANVDCMREWWNAPYKEQNNGR